MEAEPGVVRSAQDPTLSQVPIGKRAAEWLPHRKQPPCPRGCWTVGSAREAGLLIRGHALCFRQAQELPRLARDITKIDQAAALTNKIKEIAVLTGGGIGPAAGSWAGQMNIERPARAVAGIADDPVIAIS